jgi:hypothetical protein
MSQWVEPKIFHTSFLQRDHLNFLRSLYGPKTLLPSSWFTYFHWIITEWIGYWQENFIDNFDDYLTQMRQGAVREMRDGSLESDCNSGQDSGPRNTFDCCRNVKRCSLSTFNVFFISQLSHILFHYLLRYHLLTVIDDFQKSFLAILNH